MSINYFLNKIKGKAHIDNFTILYLLVIIGVGVSAFGLGRLSISNESTNSEVSFTENKSLPISSFAENTNTTSLVNQSSVQKVYVASKNGKLYYPTSCALAKRILAKNAIWFSTSAEAEKSGYQLSLSCK